MTHSTKIIAALSALALLLSQASAEDDNGAVSNSNLRKNKIEGQENMNLDNIFLDEESLDDVSSSPIHEHVHRRLAECDWSGYNDWARDWQVSCSSDIDEIDYLTGIGCVIADFSGTGGACSTAWLKEKLTDIGAEIASDVDLSKLIGGSLITEGGLDIKAAVLTGTGCKHCVFSWLCYPRANRHRVCLAWRGSKNTNPNPPPPPPTPPMQPTWPSPTPPSSTKCYFEGKQYNVGQDVYCWDCAYDYCTCLASGSWGNCRN